MSVNKTAAPCAITEAARDSEKPREEFTEKPPRNSTRRRPRGPDPWRSLDDLVRNGLLETFVNLGSRP